MAINWEGWEIAVAKGRQSVEGKRFLSRLWLECRIGMILAQAVLNDAIFRIREKYHCFRIRRLAAKLNRKARELGYPTVDVEADIKGAFVMGETRKRWHQSTAAREHN